jgi:hypothetical protein
MTLAALVLSVVAILVAGVSAFYTKQQADAAEATRLIEASRRHQETAPDLDAVYVGAEPARGKVHPVVLLTNRGPLDLDRVEVQAVPPPHHEEAVIEGIYDPATGGKATTHETGPLRRGESWTALEVIPAKTHGTELERGGTVTSRCTCYAASEDPWTILVDVEFPGGPYAFYS